MTARSATPDPAGAGEVVVTPQITRYQDWLARERGLAFGDYEALWRWSVDDLPGFWRSIWDYFDVQSPQAPRNVLAHGQMPNAQWFPEVSVNYARQALRHADDAHAAGHPAIVWTTEALFAQGVVQELSWPELRRQVAALAARLRQMGVQPGDRVAAFLPNVPHTVVAFLAVASVGAVWSVCAPDMGQVAVLDRFRQIAPKVLFACDGYVYGGRPQQRLPVVHALLDALPSVCDVVLLPWLDPQADPGELATPRRRAHAFDALVAGEATYEPAWLPFQHPLWVVYSSGTTGMPKPIVHGHGGVMLEGLKLAVLHNDLGASADTGDRFHWYSSTGWIMWNCQVGALLGGTTICLFDGSPAGPAGDPDWSTLWRFVAASGTSFFGAGAAYYASCLKASVDPGAVAAREPARWRLRALGSTGSPLADECYRWVWDHVPKVDGQDIWLAPISGGTDFAGAFIGGLRTLPVTVGEMQCRCLGAAVEAWSEPDAQGRGQPLLDEVGELVCTRPMPSMPLYFWGDTDGQRYRESYFDTYVGAHGEAIWRHGDWLRLVPHQGYTGAVIYGRSDATINRHGIRIGTSELYRAVEVLPEVLDSLVVDLEYLGRESYMPLFVVLREGLTLDEALASRIKTSIRQALSGRHVPNEVLQVPAVPRTLSGKKMELPVKKLLLGQAAQQVLNRDAMSNPACIDWYVAFAARRNAAPA